MPTETIHVDHVTDGAAVIAASRPLHEEREGAPVWMRATGAVLLLAGAALTAAVLAWPGSAPEAALVVPGVAGIVVGFLLLLAQSGLTITAQDVVLHFRPLPSLRIAREGIIDVRLVDADAATYGGLGLRIGRRRRALLMTPGLGIEFTDERGRITFVRTRQPESAFRAMAGLPGGTAPVERERLDA